jgi:5-methylcytosine-specific restriction endonuclease McrA
LNLRSLSDDNLLSRLSKLVARERETTLLILHHLNEIERRKLHLKLGYRSMFDYCTSALGYSESAAGRRIQAARCVAHFPDVCDLLAANDVNLSTVAQVSRLLTKDNKERLLARIRGKSQREVEGIAAEYCPREKPRDRVRTVVVRVPVAVPKPAEAAGGSLGMSPSNGTAMRDHSRNGSDRESSSHSGEQEAAETGRGGSNAEAQPFAVRQLRRVLIQFSAAPEFMAKLDRVKSLMWHRLPSNASLEQVFGLALEHLIERQDPRKRRERREKGRHGRGDAAAEDRSRSRRQIGRNRHVPMAVRDEVYARDQGQCTFVGPGGRRCGATRALQLDHISPVARGGRGSPDNLRLLCAYHNRLEAERLLGPGVASRFRRRE